MTYCRQPLEILCGTPIRAFFTVSLPLLAWGAHLRRKAGAVEPVEVPAVDEDGEPVQEALRYAQVPFGPFLAASALAYVFLFDRLAPVVAAWIMPQ